MAKRIINNVIEIEEVDESWALKLLNECEQDESIFVEEPLESNADNSDAPTAIELQVLQYKQYQQSLNNVARSDLKLSDSFKKYLKSLFA